MPHVFHPLLALIASATDRELAKYVEYLKYENKILRARLPKQIHTTTEERGFLLKFGKAVGKAIDELISIVSPASFYRWVRDEKDGKKTPNQEVELCADEFHGVSFRVNRLRWMGRA
jgi:putative transposase